MKEYFDEIETKCLINMIKSTNMDIVHFALDLIIESDRYLPYRYNEPVVIGLIKILPEVLKSIALDHPMSGGQWTHGKFSGRGKILQKKINKVRAKHTYNDDSI